MIDILTIQYAAMTIAAHVYADIENYYFFFYTEYTSLPNNINCQFKYFTDIFLY